MFAWRRILLRLFGAKIGRNVLIRPSAKITYPWKVSIGDYSWIGDNAVLYSLGEIEIGNNTVISQRCYLCTASHKYDDPSFPIQKNHYWFKCWLATDVYVAPGISIDNSCVVGARSSVFTNLDQKVYIGSPAKYLKKGDLAKNIIVIGINYYPEDSAIGLYTTQKVEALVSKGHNVTVITGFPYYPAWEIKREYKTKPYLFEEEINGVRVLRSKQYVPKKTFFKRIVHLISFTFGNFINLFKVQKSPDLIISIVPFTTNSIGVNFKDSLPFQTMGTRTRF